MGKMDSPEEIRRKLESIEAEIHRVTSDAIAEEVDEYEDEDDVEEVIPRRMKSRRKKKGLRHLISRKFDKLTTVGKVGVIAVTMMVSLAILGAIFKLVVAGLAVAAVLTLGYFGYKFLMAGD